MKFVSILVLLALVSVNAKKHKKNKKAEKRSAEYDIRVLGTIPDTKSKIPSDNTVHPDYPLMGAFQNEDIFTENQLRVNEPAGHQDSASASKKNKIHQQSAAGHEHIKHGKSLEERLEDKLDQLSMLEGNLFELIKDVKSYLKLKNKNAKKSMLPHLEELSKRSDLETLTSLRKTVNTDKIIDDLLREPQASQTATADTRDTLFGALSDNDPAFASQSEFVSNGEDTPISKIDEESERKDSMANARDVIQDGLVESPFSDLNFKKPSGKKSHLKSLS